MGFIAQPTLAFIPMDHTMNVRMADFNCYSTAHSVLILREYYTSIHIADLFLQQC